MDPLHDDTNNEQLFLLPKETCNFCNKPHMTPEEMERSAELNLLHKYNNPQDRYLGYPNMPVYWIADSCRKMLVAKFQASEWAQNNK